MGLTLVREDRVERTSGVRVVVPTAALGSYVRTRETLKASKRETLHEMRSPWTQVPKGSWKMTRSIGRVYKRGDALSLPILISREA